MSAPISAAVGHRKGAEIVVVDLDSPDDDLRHQAVRELQDALRRAAKRWADAAQAFGKACYSRDRDVSGRASQALIAAQANYDALNRAAFDAIAHALHNPLEADDVS